MPSISVLFGRRLRVLRNERGLSQEQLAKMCGLHRHFVAQVERAEKNIRLDDIARIAAGLQRAPRTALPDGRKADSLRRPRRKKND